MPSTPLAAIPNLAQLYTEGFLPPSTDSETSATPHFTTKISFIRTDITTLAVDAIVNAANTSLLGGGGVDGAIHRAAGPALFDECETLDGCDTGSAKITSAYRLPCKKVIHAVGPVYYSAKRKNMHTTLLQSCYTQSLDLAVQNDCRSIAFSALSTGVYGYPSREAAVAAIKAVKGWFEADVERAKKMDRVIFCQFMEKDQRAYEELLPRYFTPATGEKESPKDESEGEVVKKDAEESTTETPSTTAIDATSQETTAAHEDPKPITTASPAQPSEKAKIAPPSTPLPDLPDVPTKEPALPGEPEVKKLKLSQ